jgi:putative spermidine/putrescine transport system substrate-binding protein
MLKAPHNLSRRTFAAAALNSLAAPAVRAETARRVSVMTFGSTWERVLKPLAPGLKQETGIEIVPVIENSAMEGLSKLQASRAKPGVDVWFAGQAVAMRAATDPDLFLKLPIDRMANLQKLVPGAYTDNFVAYWYFPTGIVYRPDLVPGGKIESWQDLFKPALRNEIALPAPSVYPGRTIIIASLFNGGSIDNVEPGIEFLGRMRDQVAMFHSSDTTARRALARGEIWAMMGSPSALKELADQNIPVAMICPKPTPLIFEGMVLVNNGNGDAAAEFVNRSLGADWQQFMTDTYNLAPVNTEAHAPEALLKLLPGKADAYVVDEAKVNANLGGWTEKFNAAIGK